MYKLLLVVPCYNEQEILEKTYSTLSMYFSELKERNAITADSKICFVNDGSRDSTWIIIDSICKRDSTIIGLKLSRNFGHQAALVAGLLHHKNQFDCYVSIDADLQDDLRAIDGMLEKYKEGSKIVYGVRNDRSTDSFFKRFTAETFYKLMQRMGVPTVYNHADFRLIDNQVLNEFSNFGETNLFIRGIIPMIGFQSDKVYYKRLEREAGESKYPLRKMLIFAWNGITSFSTVPMKLVLWFGIFNFVFAMGITVWVLVCKLFGFTVQGWTSIVLPMTFFSGSNMIAIGLIGEYVGKIYEEVKARPRYIIETVLNEEKV
ncbi:glycosyltransferase family 2 protein [Emticicia sp. W12TSBA100-4]|uniref:glycosyltransferase family 2 protein n=1 Tax=Emticicia sp. W12TSBA100-4 TaxID=3160965 RepID=UPI0033063D86